MLRTALVIGSAWALVCGSGVRAEPVARLVVQPAALELRGAGDCHGLLVSAEGADGLLADVTAKATFVSGNTGVASISPLGECQSRGDGSTQITVSYSGQTITVPVVVLEGQRVRAPSFVNDVTPLFTRQGCNQGACHGKNAGQNGFRLSLRGYAPEWDHLSLTREFEGRRVSTAVPEDSLLLRKPLGLAPHGGGKLLREGSREHALLLDWLRAGTPGPAKDEPAVKQLEILPGSRVYRVGQEQQLLVRAEYTDGRRRDVTWLSRFDSNDAGIAAVDATGRVRVLHQGETAVRASFMGQVAVAVATVPYDPPASPPSKGGLAQRNNFIDDAVSNKLVRLRLEPSDLCTDQAFLRRAFLDTIGTLPTPDEVRAFLNDQGADKRSQVIDSLLDRPEFVDYWTQQLADLLQNRKESDHDVRGTKGVRAFHEWLRQQVAANRPWDQLARAVMTVKGKATDSPAVGYYIVTVGERNAMESEVVASAAQAFLGTRIGCARCHNHPLEKYTQDDYYHFAAYFSRVKMERKEPRQGATTLIAVDPGQGKNPVGVTQPRTGQFMKPQPLDRSALPVEPGEDPRIKLAAWMTDPKNEAFSGAMVNRLWQHFFGVGLVEPVDDLRASNPPSNQELWQALNKEFVAHRFDLKHLMRVILSSRTYQLSSTTRLANESESRFYSHYYARRLPAEVFLDAISQSTGLPEAFPGYPVGIRAQQLPDPSLKSYFLTLFGRPERITACACERNGEVTMPQLLHLYGGETIMQKINAPEGRLAGLMKAKKTEAQVVEELFLTTVSRLPSASETAAVAKELTQADRKDEVLRDVFWALLNSKEFAFNH